MTNWKTTWCLLGSAAALFAFIYFLERHIRPATANAASPAPLLSIRASEVTNIVLRRTNQFVLRAERANQQWNLTLPTFYPAQGFAVERLLKGLQELSAYTYLSQQDLAAQKSTLASFGLDMPAATLLLQHNGRRTELLFGSRTPVGDQVYLQLLDTPGVYLVNGDIFDLLPPSANQWRETALINVADMAIDRIEVRSPTRTFAIEVNPTNRMLYLSKPSYARASLPKVEALLDKIRAAHARQFVTDDPRADLDLYGLRPAAAELVFGQGTNDVAVVQFGKSPTNDPGVVYARRMAQTNIVLVPRAVFEALQTSHAELRDRHLLSFPAAALDAIDVSGTEPFSVRRQTNGVWLVTEPQVMPADSDLMREWINQLSFLEGNVEKDVVTDLAPFGLSTPARQYVLRGSFTNSAGALTNRVLGQLSVGSRRDNYVFARGEDDSVYTLSVGMVDRLPATAWQLRDRRVWSFSTNQIARVSVAHRGYTRELLRGSNGEWSLGPGSQGVINTFAVEETMYRLGELRAISWVARGEEVRSQYGFADPAYKMGIELRLGDKLRTLNLEFSSRQPSPNSPYPYALASIDGQTWIFEFPPQLFRELLNYVGNPPLSAASGRE